MSSTLNAATSGGLTMTSDTSGILKLQTAGTDAVTITAAQNVGIGTSSPSQKLSVAGAIASTGGSSIAVYGKTNSDSISNTFYLQNSDGSKAANLQLGTTGILQTWVYGGSSWVNATTIDSSGNVGIGTSSPAAKLHVQNQIYVKGTGGGDGAIGVDINSGASAVTTSAHAIRSGGGAGNSLIIETQTANSSGQILFQTNNAERARIDSSGNLLVGGTTNTNINTNGGWYASVSGTPYTTTGHASGTASGQPYSYFFYANNAIGSITQNGTTAVAYNTSSDYRLKENIAPMTGALDVVAQLNPVTYNWKSDGSDGQGFIAHELQEVVPDCVTGAKDATEIQQYEISPAVPATYDEEGNELTPAVEAVMGEREVPVYQGIDTSFLVATLTAAIKEMKEIIDQQSERITALEGAAQ